MSKKNISPTLVMLITIILFPVLVGLFYAMGSTLVKYQGTGSDNETITVDGTSSLDTLSFEEKMRLTDDQWREYLTPQQFKILRQAGTELTFTGELLHNKQKGTYVTADCGEPVFRSEEKYDSQTGWPSFWAPVDESAVELRVDNSDGIERTEVVSKKCGSHLGHVFDDGPEPTGKRYCINSAALKFIPDEE